MQSVGGLGNRHHCRDWGGIQGSACSSSLPVMEQRHCVGVDCEAMTVSAGVSPSERILRIKQRGRKGKEAMAEGRSCRIAVKDGTPCVAAAPRHSFEKRWASAFLPFCFYCSAFSVFCSKIIIPSLNSGSHSCVSCLFNLHSRHHEEKQNTRHWKRGSGGEKKSR